MALVLAATAILAACGEGTPDEQQARQVAAGFLNAYAAQDADLCGLASADVRANVVLRARAAGGDPADCEQAMSASQSGLPDEQPELLGAEEIRSAATGIDSASFAAEGDHALITFPGGKDGTAPAVSFVALVVEDGEWRVDDFEAGGAG